MSTSHPAVTVTYLDRVAALLEPQKHRSYELMSLREGSRVLDVGCGPATDTLALATRVGDAGHVYGVDLDPAMVAEANARAAYEGLRERITHRRGDALSLPFADDTFDAVRAERLLVHVDDVTWAVAEIVRVVKPGGRVVLMETDWSTVGATTTEPELERRLTRFLPAYLLRSGYAAKLSLGAARSAGLKDVVSEALPVVLTRYTDWFATLLLADVFAEAVRCSAMTAEEVARLGASFHALDADGAFVGSLNMLLVSGSKPGSQAEPDSADGPRTDA